MTGRFGEIDIGDDFDDDDPLGMYLTMKLNQDVSDRTMEIVRNMLQSNRAGTAVDQFLNRRDVDILDASVKDFTDYKKFAREQGHNDRGIENRLTEASTFYNYMMDVGETNSNPAGWVLYQSNLDTDSPERDYHTVEEISEFLKSIPDPEIRTLVLYYLKYGLRRGAGVNTDLQCVNIDHPEYKDYLEDRGIELHQEVRDRPDSIYIYPKFSGGETIAGEKRKDGNKRQRASVVPIGPELKQALLEWLTIRPETGPPHPLFTQLRPIGEEFSRLSGRGAYDKIIQQYAIEYGITDAEDANRSDVDIHYFRHFFGTQMRRHRADHDGALDLELIKYIRGDLVDDDVMDIYTHNNWGVNTREPYLENIYQFGLYD